MMNKNELLTKKQLELLHRARGGLKRINILHGSVRSGKTYISLVLWCIWIRNMPQNGSYLMAAKTLSTLKRNCLDLLVDIAGERNFSYSISKKEATLFGRRIYLEGVSDVAAESKIRGLTLTGAYCDELTLFTEDFFSMLLSRLSDSGAKLFATTNPEGPSHWFKANYLDRSDELDIFVMQFLIDDNTFLSPDYIENLKKEYTGLFYRRFILGEWVNAEGLVYPMFDKMRHVISEPPEAQAGSEFYISVDYGTLNPCSMGLWRLDRERAVRISEFYYSGRDERALMTDEEYYSALLALAADYPIKYVIVDPSAASFIETIRRGGKFVVRRANNSVLDGIRRVAALLEGEKLLFCSCCKATIKEFYEYSWDKDGADDKVIKRFDHAMDDIRYFVNTVRPDRLLIVK